jgi:biotin transporter BioY
MHQDPDTGQAHPRRAELLAGLAVIALAAGFLWLSRDYGMGTLRRMGAGFFPVVLGWAGVGLGALICAQAVLARDLELLPATRLRRLIFIAAAFVAFGLAIDPLGLPLTLFVTSLIGSLADRETQRREAVLLALVLAAGITALFVGLLGLPLPVWPGGG